MRKFDASIPRKMFWSTDTGNTDFCPDCRGRLERDSQSYLLLVRENGDVQPLIIGNRDGYFCANCPVVVLDYDAFAESAIAGNPSNSGFEFSVAGIVDLDAVPEEKANVPLGEDDNPVPLVRFTNIFNDGLLSRRRRRGKLKKSRRKNKQRK